MEVVRGVGVDIVVEFGREVVITMVFDMAACASRGDGGQEVLYTRIGGGVEGGHATDAICGRRVWKRCRMRESGLVSGWNSCVMESWSWKGSRSLCSLNLFIALQIAAAMVMTKSGVARVRGQSRPRPPARRLSWLMRMA